MLMAWSSRIAVLLLLFTTSIATQAADETVDFDTVVRPILERHCWSCHGLERQESGLRLDRHASVLEGGDQGRIVIPGNSSGSRLIEYVSGANPDSVMPPEGDRLTDAEIQQLRSWIDQGVHWSSKEESFDTRLLHWAWQPIGIPAIPDVRQTGWPRNEIDHFVLAELERRGIAPSPEADRATLIRRLSLDLTGLLPSPEEVHAFVNDTSPDAYENLVDRLLASPHFGERWGRHWLDMARYADSDGYEKDNARPDAWRWRDWVIDAINQDMPFDQFTVEQLAGDLLPNATPMQKLATAFHRQTLTNTEGGTDQEEFRVAACFDRTETTSSIWLGLTVGCARCHTHKYDPITQREYYQLFAFFNNGDEQNTVVPGSTAEAAAYERARTVYDSRVEELRNRLHPIQQRLEPEYQTWVTRMSEVISDPKQSRSSPLAFSDIKYASDGGAGFTPQTDGSVLVTGANPDRIEYTVTGRLDAGQEELTSLRLDVLPHSELPAMGPGRVQHGNFVLSEVTVEYSENSDFSDARVMEFVAARADFEQSDRPWKAEHVIDGKPETGWAIASEYGKPHWLVLGLKRPIPRSQPLFLRYRLSHQYGSQHSIGCFRITPQSGFEPGLTIPESILKALTIKQEDRTPQQNTELLEHFCRTHQQTSSLMEELDQLRKDEPKKPEMTVRVLAQRLNDPRRTFVLRRGEFLQPMQELEMQPGGISFLPTVNVRVTNATSSQSPSTLAPKEVMADRLDLARWLVSNENPLTPRVTVNHVWRILFGQGIVRTPSDFGVRGERPTHPELLDWLASDFMGKSGSLTTEEARRGWSRKALIRRIVTSAVYRQASRNREDLREMDPQNLLLARQNRLRVEGEIVRDISLQAAGLLSTTIGGPSVYPPLPPGIAELSYAGNFKWTESTGEDRFRRGMYTFFKRTSPHPNLMTFDCPDANITCIARQTSNTPLQALTSLNNETFAEASRAFADRITAPTSNDEEKIAGAFEICVSRRPTPSELVEVQQLLNDARQWYKDQPEQAAALGGSKTSNTTDAIERAAWISVARILINLDEFITRE
ncbi:MAG: DUF1549 domain-containing protein [Planctomyces sp.]|nr:DUF1549 domain-containing protein [Planctomyces sp.]